MVSTISAQWTLKLKLLKNVIILHRFNDRYRHIQFVIDSGLSRDVLLRLFSAAYMTQVQWLLDEVRGEEGKRTK